MEANGAPERVYINPSDLLTRNGYYAFTTKSDNNVEYTRTDAFIEKVINFLNYKLDDVVSTRVPGTIIPHHVAKQELIEDFEKYING